MQTEQNTTEAVNTTGGTGPRELEQKMTRQRERPWVPSQPPQSLWQTVQARLQVLS